MGSTRSAIARAAATCLAAIAVLLTGYVLAVPSAAALSTGDVAGHRYDTSADAAPPAEETQSVVEPGEASEASLVLTDVLVHDDNSGSLRSFVAPSGADDLLDQARAARNARADKAGSGTATVTGGYDPATGRVVSGCSSNPVGCAELDVVRQLSTSTQPM